MLNSKSILKEEILSFLSESKQYQKSRKFLLENSDSFSDHVFNEQFKKLFLEALDYDSHFKDNPDIAENLRQVALEFRNIAPELSNKYQQFVNNSIQNPLDRSKKTIWDYKNFIDSWQDNEAFGKALHMAAKKINPDSFGPSRGQAAQTQQKFPSGRLVQHIVEWLNQVNWEEDDYSSENKYGNYIVKKTQKIFPSKPLVQKFFEVLAEHLRSQESQYNLEENGLEKWAANVSEEIQDFGEDFDFYQYFPELSKNSSTNQQPSSQPISSPISQQPSVASQQKPLTDEEKIINQFLKKIDMKGFIEKWLEKSKEALSPEGRNAILEYCRDELFSDHLLSESQLVKLSRERLAQIIKEEMK